ncbi:CoA-binding protein [Robiginitalea sp.]|nr:CoA-binding protein [Robiginitalea sp.]
MGMKKTLVLGASLNPERYSNIALKMLSQRSIEAVGFGPKSGEAYGVPIVSDLELLKEQDIDTVSLYVRAALQTDYYNFILELKPDRVIFNPGTENPELSLLLEAAGIKAEVACTLVLLTTGVY